MPGKRLSPLLAIAMLAFAGCSGSTRDAEDDPDSKRSILDPNDFSYLENASAVAHVHDYWDGQERVALIEDRIHWEGGPSTGNSGQAWSFRAKAGDLVNPGTDRIEVQATYQNQYPVEVQLEFKWQSRVTNTSGQVALPSGETVAVDVEEQQADVGHSKVSQWQFWLVMGPAPVAYWKMDVEVLIEIVRVEGDLPLQPPHPDQWGANLSKILFDDADALWENQDPEGRPDEARSAPRGPAGMSVVPFQTRELRLIVAYNSSTPPAQHYQDPVLRWHGADRYPNDFEETNHLPDVVRIQSRDGWIEWRIDVEPRMWDSPYWTESAWLLPWSSSGAPSMDGDFHVWVEAVRADPGASEEP